MAKFGTFKYGDGTKYSNPNIVVFRYNVNADATPTTSGLSFQQLFRVSTRVTHSGSIFIVNNIRPIVGDGGYYPHNYDCPVGVQNIRRISIRVKHSNGTLFEINQVRPIVENLQQEPVG